MSTPMYLFMGFIALGLIFFFSACFLAARPASGTTEWINYKCGRKFTFCPAPKPLKKYDIFPICILTLISFGIILLSAAFIDHLDTDTSPVAALLDTPLFPIGTGYIYPSHLMFVIMIPLLYVSLKNLAGGYLIPISGTIIMLIDSTSLLLSHNSATIGVTLFVLIAFYIAYRYTITPKKLYLSFIGIALGVAITLNASASLAIIGILAIFTIKEITLYLANKDKKQTVIRSILFITFCVILPTVIYLSITILCKYTSFIASLANACSVFAAQFGSFDFYSLSHLSVLSPMVFIGGIFALPCCIYQVIKAKDGTSLFTLIPFAIYILSIFVTGITGLLPIFAIPVIARGFSALHNRKQKYWIFAYLFTAVLYLGFLYVLTVI